MKKNLFVLLIAMVTALVANAQIDFSNLRIDVGGNYTMYKGDFQQKTAGVKARLSLPINENMALGIGFTYGFPIKIASQTALSGGGSVPSEFVYKFKTIHLEYDYYFGGEKEEGLSVYASGRLGFVWAKYDEKIKGTVPPGEDPIDLVEPGSENGFTINVALGTQYSLGRIKVFGDAGIALPANQVNGQYVENVIPAHFMFNLGLRIPFGGGSDY